MARHELKNKVLNVEYIQRLLESRHITKSKMCGLINVGRETYDGVMNGGDCRLSMLEKMADFFGVPIWSLLKGAPIDGIQIRTTGPNSPGMMQGSTMTVYGGDLASENASLRREIALKDELLSLYRRQCGELATEDKK